MKKICIIGGINLAVISSVDSELAEDSSIFGSIYTRFGGVAFNIASELSQFTDVEIELMTVLSNDVFGNAAVTELEMRKIEYRNSIFINSWHSFYCDIHSPTFHYGINNMEIVGLIDAKFIESKKEIIEGFDILLVDENLDSQTLEYIANNLDVPLFCDATSVIKCRRIKPVIDKVDVIKFNKKEFCKFFDYSEEDISNDEKIIKTFTDLGVNNVFVTLGKDGSFCFMHGTVTRYKSILEIKVINSIQAGDAFFSGAVISLLNNDDISTILRKATVCAEHVLKINNSTFPPA